MVVARTRSEGAKAVSISATLVLLRMTESTTMSSKGLSEVCRSVTTRTASSRASGARDATCAVVGTRDATYAVAGAREATSTAINAVARIRTTTIALRFTAWLRRFV